MIEAFVLELRAKRLPQSGAMPRGVLSRHEAHTRGRADGSDRVSLGEARAFGSKLVERRCGVIFAAVSAQVAVTQIIGHDVHDVRALGLGRFSASGKEEGRRD